MELLHTPINDWRARFLAFFIHFFAGLARREVVEAANSYLVGLLMPLANKNCWSIAEETGAANPQPHQRLLRTARWDEHQLCQARRSFIVDHYGSPDGMLLLDETGILKDGADSVGVHRQYTGTAGKLENCQVAVFAAYASEKGRILMDTRLFLPDEAWAQNEERRQKAGVPEEVEFATKIELARQLVDQAITDKLPIRWVGADAVYGASFEFRQGLIDHRLRFVLGVRANTYVYTQRPILLSPSPARRPRKPGRPRTRKRIKGTSERVDQIAGRFQPNDWKRIAVADGSKGCRVYDWAARRVFSRKAGRGTQDLWLVVRRSLAKPSEMAYYLGWAPAQTPLVVLAQVASGRWQIEQCFLEAKGEVGLDDYQVRKWRPWHRHMQLVMLAHLFLTELRREHGTEDVLGPLSVREARRLLRIVLEPEPRSVQHRLQWSIWRRKHNHKARSSHYRRRLRRGFKPK